MQRLIMIILFTCGWAVARSQVNFVKNPSFEKYTLCPDGWNQVHYAKFWRNVTDSVMDLGMEYYNICGNDSFSKNAHVPDNGTFYQYPHRGNGMVGAHLYNDKTIWFEKGSLPFNYRDNLQGHLVKPLTSGKVYCVSFWVNNIEGAGYANNKIGAYLDNGAINAIADTPGEEITTVIPQVFTNKILEDTTSWEKIEGSFTASGTETHISIGNFFPNSAVATKVTNYWAIAYTTSYYLIDDVCVVPIDLKADAGKDTHAELGKKTFIGRVGDTTAEALDCKWYKKGVLIDSGAIINVNAGASVGKIDTYVVVQTICGLVSTDTVTVRTVPVGMKNLETEKAFSIYPNPSNGSLNIVTLSSVVNATIKIYDQLGRIVYNDNLPFANNKASLDLNATNGFYIVELIDAEGNSYRQRLEISK